MAKLTKGARRTAEDRPKAGLQGRDDRRSSTKARGARTGAGVSAPAPSGQLIGRGAEAELWLVDWMGRRAVAKRRLPKPYRLTELDRSLRQARTRTEARLLREGRLAGVPTPLVYDVDLAEDACTITMEFIEGEQVKHLLNRLPVPEARALCRAIGRLVGLLHQGGVVHGDLTTSNMLWREGRIYLIDFGLGGLTGELEVQGVDLRVLKEAFGSTHAHLGKCFGDILECYVETYSRGEEAVGRMEEIAARGRYMEQVMR